MWEFIYVLSFLGWVMGAIGLVALWLNYKMRQDRERERQRETGSSGNRKA